MEKCKMSLVTLVEKKNNSLLIQYSKSSKYQSKWTFNHVVLTRQNDSTHLFRCNVQQVLDELYSANFVIEPEIVLFTVTHVSK